MSVPKCVRCGLSEREGARLEKAFACPFCALLPREATEAEAERIVRDFEAAPFKALLARLLRAAEDRGRRAEREACAKIAEAEVDALGESYDPRDVAAFTACARVARRIRECGAP